MANAKITAKTESTTPAANDVVWVQDAAGANDYKVQLQNLVYPTGVISNRSEDTSPDRTADFALTYDVDTGLNRKVLLKNLGAYPIRAEFGAVDPVDSTTYYWGGFYSLNPSTTGAKRRLYIPRAGIITAVYGIIQVAGTVGSGENVALSVRVNNTTDASIGNVTCNDAGGANTFSNASMSQAVSAGDYIEIKMVCPAWATNPTSVLGSCTIMIA